MTAGTPRPRLTRADERAIARLLAEGDDYQVMKFSLAINHYEITAASAKARLAKRKLGTLAEFYHAGGYGAAMETILSVIGELIDAGCTDRKIIRGVIDVACSAGELVFAESATEAWSGSAEDGEPAAGNGDDGDDGRQAVGTP